MHIPDGYLSPQTCAVFGGAMVPVWSTAGRRVQATMQRRTVPVLAIGAAACFLVMMFNVPIPDGTTAHAVGGVLVAVFLGPWAAVVAVSTALGIQALFFGDGGVLAFGVNCFNMAFVMPMAGYAMYWLLAGRGDLKARRRAVAAGIGGYVGLNAAALCAAIELGLQPTLFHRSDGTPLYAPFHLSQTIPTMMLAHLTVAGGAELVLTAGVVAYLQRANLPLLRFDRREGTHTVRVAVGDRAYGLAPAWRRLAVAAGVMALLTPLGLLAPGTAFGESTPEALDLDQYHLDAVPSGLRHYAGFWHHALFNGYDFAHDRHPAVGYLLSAGVGVAAIAATVAVVLLGAHFARALHASRAANPPHDETISA